MNPRLIRDFRLFWFLLVAIVGAASLSAQSGKWVVPMRKVPAGQTIEIDGRLDEPAWQGAPALSPLTQILPAEGAKPSKPTRVRLTYDRDFIYLAIECFDDPELVRARVLRRDARLDPDDRVEFWFDTFHDKRFGYWFQIGPGGSLGDALLGAGRFNKSWDGIWDGRARVTDEGWLAEVAIPYKTLVFKVGGTTWGFNLRRHRKETNEVMRWANPLVAYQFFSLPQGGTLSGFEGIQQGIGLDVIPYATARSVRDRRMRNHTSVLGDGGFDANYRLNPNSSLLVTYNTDFAQTEVDERQANLTRFPLFFPEKRVFFLEDSGMFDFGVPSRGGGSAPIPFFSRRIGRDSNGGAIPILVGGKLTARTDDWNVGVLSVFQDEHIDTSGKASDARNLSVARVSRNIGAESTAGVLFTSGNPTDSGESLTAGFDFNISDSTAFGSGKGYDVYGWWLGSQTGGAGGDGHAYGMRLQYDSRDWRTSLSGTHVESGFDPALGFVRRRAIRQHDFSTRYTWRSDQGEFLRRFQTGLSGTLTTTENGGKDSHSARLQVFDLAFAGEDSVGYSIRRSHERLFEDFQIRDGIAIAPGDYTITNHFFELETADARPVFVRAQARFGSFYTGNLTTFEVSPTVIFSPNLTVSGGYQENKVVLNEGSFTTRILSGRVDVSFSPRVTLRNLLQYDSQSKNLSVQSRLRWIHRPGQEVFLVGLFGWEREAHGQPLIPTTQEVAAKLLYTIRF